MCGTPRSPVCLSTRDRAHGLRTWMPARRSCTPTMGPVVARARTGSRGRSPRGTRSSCGSTFCTRARAIAARIRSRPRHRSKAGGTPLVIGTRSWSTPRPVSCTNSTTHGSGPATLQRRARVLSGTCDPIACGPRRGPQLTRPDYRSCPAWSTTTRSNPDTSITRSDSPPRRRAPASCGRRGTRPARPATPTTRRWERDSDSRHRSVCPGHAARGRVRW